MSFPRHPERHPMLVEELESGLADLPHELRRELAASPRGAGTRFGPPRQMRNFIGLYRKLLAGERVANMQQLARLLNVRRTEAAAILALESDPRQPRLNPVRGALVRATTRELDAHAPAKPHTIVMGAPNSPMPGVHRSGKRVDRDGPTFGIGKDGHQRIAVGFLAATWGPQDQFGYSAATACAVLPSSLDDERSAQSAGRSMALEQPALYRASLATQIAAEVDAARPGERQLPIFFIDGRRDCDPSAGTTIDPRLDVLPSDPGWAKAVRDIPGDRVKMVEASDASRTGGEGFCRHLAYRTRSGYLLSASDVEAGVKGRDRAANQLLSQDWHFLPPLDPGSPGDESANVMAFAGYVVDKRTGERAKLCVFESFTSAESYVVIPYDAKADPYRDLHVPGAQPDAQRDIALTARVHVGPALWVGECRRKAYRYRFYFYVAAKECSVREQTFSIGANVRMSELSFPGEPGYDGDL